MKASSKLKYPCPSKTEFIEMAPSQALYQNVRKIFVIPIAFAMQVGYPRNILYECLRLTSFSDDRRRPMLSAVGFRKIINGQQNQIGRIRWAFRQSKMKKRTAKLADSAFFECIECSKKQLFCLVLYWKKAGLE